VVDFGGVAANLKTFAAGTLSAARPEDDYTLYVARSQLFQFVLSAGVPGVPQDASVSLEIYNSAGQLVFSLTARAGETVSASSVFLTPGAYRVRFTGASSSGGALPSLLYRWRGSNLSDPVGPAMEDTTMQPQYQSTDDPSSYSYPNGTTSPDPYYVSPG
jgi:hypothetical protein